MQRYLRNYRYHVGRPHTIVTAISHLNPQKGEQRFKLLAAPCGISSLSMTNHLPVDSRDLTTVLSIKTIFRRVVTLLHQKKGETKSLPKQKNKERNAQVSSGPTFSADKTMNVNECNVPKPKASY